MPFHMTQKRDLNEDSRLLHCATSRSHSSFFSTNTQLPSSNSLIASYSSHTHTAHACRDALHEAMDICLSRIRSSTSDASTSTTRLWKQPSVVVSPSYASRYPHGPLRAFCTKQGRPVWRRLRSLLVSPHRARSCGATQYSVYFSFHGEARTWAEDSRTKRASQSKALSIP